MSYLPDVVFHLREGDTFERKTTSDLMKDKRVVIFGLPGAFTPTCSSFQLPGFDLIYDQLTEAGVDEVYCTAVNDAFVMNAWAEANAVTKVKMLPDGNGDFAAGLGMLVDKSNLGFGKRSWRYAIVVNNMHVERWFEEHPFMDNCPIDPYEISTPEKVLAYVQGKEDAEHDLPF